MTVLLWMFAFVMTQASGSVSGQVTDAATKTPVSEARVLLARTDGPLGESIATRTNEQGRFSLANVPAGTYRIFAVDPDYVRKEHASSIVVTPGKPVVNIAIAMTRTAVIAGRVTNEHGDAAPNVFVRAWTQTGQVAETKTNDLGEYRLFGLEPGTYTISAERYLPPRIDGTFYLGPTPPCPDCMGEGEFRQQVTALLKTGAYVDPRVILGRSYPMVYFPAATERASAAPVNARSGVVTTGIDLRLVVK
jgi:5-hydroxyisourate hydrolase-like protein (transthyretin family)